MDDAVLAIDLVSRSREQLPWRLLAHDISLACRFRCDLVCGVRLAEAKLRRGSVTSRGSYSRACSLFDGFEGEGSAHTCFRSKGVLISGTFLSIHFSKD